MLLLVVPPASGAGDHGRDHQENFITADKDGLLDLDTVEAYVRERGVLSGADAVACSRVSGGVSNVVLAVSSGAIHLIVKQALSKLNVPGEWRATRERTLIEGAAISLTSDLTPDWVPSLIDLDPEALALVIPAAPPTWVTLKDELLVGQANPITFEVLGRILAVWHNGTAGLQEVTADCDDRQSFRELRTDPFHRAAAAAHPALAASILSCADELEQQRACLVHGDFSPKNILVGAEGLWVIDFEVAHIGAPVFDVAFLLTHLILKAVHRPQHAHSFELAATRFLTTYFGTVAASLACDPQRLVLHLGCLLLARVDGLSPAAYLDEAARTLVRTVGIGVLSGSLTEVQDVFEAVRVGS